MCITDEYQIISTPGIAINILAWNLMSLYTKEYSATSAFSLMIKIQREISIKNQQHYVVNNE
jgi:hypothetical protein